MAQVAMPTFVDGMEVHATDLAPLRSNILDHESRMPEIIGGKRFVTGSTLVTTSGGTEILTTMNIGSVTFTAGKAYEVEFGISFESSVNGDTILFQLKKTNVVGPGVVAKVLPPSQAGVPLWLFMRAVYKPTVTAAETFVATVQRIGGSGTIAIKASALGSTYAVAKLGAPSTVLVDI